MDVEMAAAHRSRADVPRTVAERGLALDLRSTRLSASRLSFIGMAPQAPSSHFARMVVSRDEYPAQIRKWAGMMRWK